MDQRPRDHESRLKQPDPVELKSASSVEPASTPGSIDALVEHWLERTLPAADAHPQALHRAMRYAVFSGGKRLRPQLLLQVAYACGAQPAELELALRAACAVELIHAASLVHDDLPCFDDAAARRGQPTVHARFGESMAVLVGDALMSQAFEILADTPLPLSHRALRLVRMLCQATGSSSGIIGGQSLEHNGPDRVHGATPLFSPELIERYHAMKTGALFRLATESAAVATGAADPAGWAMVGDLVGMGYQLADDLLEVRGRTAELGRPSTILIRSESELKTQMKALLPELRARILSLAVAPGPLLTFLDGVHGQFLRSLDTA